MSDIETDSLAFDQQPDLPKRTSRIRRLGCWIGLSIWLVLLLLPCIAIVLISQGEIAIQTGDLPGQSFRLWLIQDSKERGIGIANPSVSSSVDGTTCLQTTTSFLLWMGSGEPSSYCECYTRTETSWDLVSTLQGSCNP
ncbi:MAG: hypothetical protein LCI00_03965 [Chloroflexi bacterium]|nr:hypothetical protein [Chloroflexota bacterium]MCC6891221.1 hypothetical protein [Anaerolineae bacterium]